MKGAAGGVAAAGGLGAVGRGADGVGADRGNSGRPVAGDGGVAVAVGAGRSTDSGRGRGVDGISVRSGGAAAGVAAAGRAGGGAGGGGAGGGGASPSWALGGSARRRRGWRVPSLALGWPRTLRRRSLGSTGYGARAPTSRGGLPRRRGNGYYATAHRAPRTHSRRRNLGWVHAEDRAAIRTADV